MKTQSVTEQVRELYDQVPYFAYGEDYFPVIKSLGMSREEFAAFAKDKRALEVGCGGGHLSAFLSQFFESVVGADISPHSLERARAEAAKRRIKNLEFIQADLFDEAFVNANESAFDFVLCYGVLHHTANSSLGYARLVKLLKPGGLLVVGVYSRTMLKYRLQRKWVLLNAGDNWQKRKEQANRLFFGGKGSDLELYDGYVNPQVSFHSIAEVFNWLKSNRLAYVGSWPPIELFAYLDLIRKHHVRRTYSSLNYSNFMFMIVELLWLLRGKSIMVSLAGKKV